MAKKYKKGQILQMQKNGNLGATEPRDYNEEIKMEFVSPEDIIIMPNKSTKDFIADEPDFIEVIETVEAEVETDEELELLVNDPENNAVVILEEAPVEETEDELEAREDRIKKSKLDPNDFRTQKALRIGKLPKKQRSAKIKSEKELVNLLVSSKKEIYDKSNKSKLLKKYNVKRIYRDEFDRLYLEKTKRIAQMILMFQPKGQPIPIEEVYWEIQNEITSQQKLYKNKEIRPFHKIDEFAFCDYLVWSCRYMFEMMYDYDEMTLDYLKDDCFRLSKQIYSRLNQKNAFGAERSAIELLDYLLDKYSWAGVSEDE